MLQFFLAAVLLAGLSLASSKRPNILFVLTDDQDSHMEAAEHMPYLQDLIISRGTTYTQHFCTVALCCPSRATLWTGRAAHNHNITNVAPPHGGYPKFVSQGFNDDNLFLWMQEAGYNTYYTGKLYNFHSTDNYDMPYARGFNSSDFLLDPYTYQYWNAKMTHNGEVPTSYAGQYSTDVVARKANALLGEGLQHLATASNDDERRPFFLTVAPIAPHSNWVLEAEKNLSYLLEPMAAPRHQHMFTDYKIPRDIAYNAAIEGSVGWISSLPSLNDTVLAYNDHYQRQRLRALQAVDEMLPQLIQQLEDAGELDNTYIFYTTDNGYHISQHRMNPGKECGYDTDIHIPFYVRGPGIEEKGVVDVITTHTDVSSTLLQIAGVTKQLDGAAIPLGSGSEHEQAEGEELPRRREHATIEYWGAGVPEGLYGGRTDNKREAGQWRNFYLNNTYKGLRLVSEEYSLYYSVWCTNETEFYDLKASLHLTDAHQVVNMAADISAYSAFEIAGRSLTQIIPRLDALMMVLKTCKDKVCVHPWRTLHPDGKVNDLKEALDQKYDSFYEEQPKMSFGSCLDAYYLENENQAAVKSWEESQDGAGLTSQPEFDYAMHWQLLT